MHLDFSALVKSEPNFNGLTMDVVKKMKVAELKEQLKARGLGILITPSFSIISPPLLLQTPKG